MSDTVLHAEIFAARRDVGRRKREVENIELAAKAMVLNHFIFTYHVGYEQALKLYELRETDTLVAARTWLMQGPQVVHQRAWNQIKNPDVMDDEDEDDSGAYVEMVVPILPKDLFYKISGIVLGLQQKSDIKQVMHGMQANLLESVVSANSKKYTAGLFTSHRHAVKQAEVVECYEGRVGFLRK